MYCTSSVVLTQNSVMSHWLLSWLVVIGGGLMLDFVKGENETPQSSCASPPVEPVPSWIQNGGSLLVIVGVLAMFWGFAFICEEYCVPAISVFCKRNKISDDIAGAIFIGAGLSSPSMFTSYVGLFVSNSAIGVGTVIGGDTFNLFVNLAVSVWVSPSRRLPLDKVVFTREVFFCVLSFLILICVVKGNISVALSESLQVSKWTNCMSITWVSSFVLVLNYLLYCFVEAYFNVFPRWLRWIRTTSLEFLFPERRAPFDQLPTHLGDASPEPDPEPSSEDDPKTFVLEPLPNSQESTDNAITFNDEVYKKNMERLLELDRSKIDGSLELQMLKRSEFYHKYHYGCVPANKLWQLRYFTLDKNGMSYRTFAEQPRKGSHVRFINLFDLRHVAVTNPLLNEFTIELQSERKKYCFRVDDAATLAAVMERLGSFLNISRTLPSREREEMAEAALLALGEGSSLSGESDEDGGWEAVFTPPNGALGKTVFYVTWPMRLLVFLTIPDVRRTGGETKSVASILACLVWLALVSFVLVVSLNVLSTLWGVNGVVLGLSIAAWASSYPALWSSVVVAREGYGDMAACNAIGSNTFNNYIGLGMPWLTYSIVYAGKPYDSLQDDGMVVSILALALLHLVVFVVIAVSGWTIKSWMAPFFLLLYFAYLSVVIYFTAFL